MREFAALLDRKGFLPRSSVSLTLGRPLRKRQSQPSRKEIDFPQPPPGASPSRPSYRRLNSRDSERRADARVRDRTLRVSRTQELLRLADRALDVLAPLFKQNRPEIVVVPRRVRGSLFPAEYNHERNVIHVDPSELGRLDDLEVIHTIGEEVGHNLHFLRRPELFPRARPGLDVLIASVADGEHGSIIWDSMTVSNLLEMVGFYSGLRFLEAMKGASALRRYRERCEPELAAWTLAAGLGIVAYWSRIRGKAVTEQYQQRGEKLLADLEAVEPDAGPKDARSLMIDLTHRTGYRLALDMDCWPAVRQRELFDLALTVDTLPELVERGRIPVELPT